MVIARSFPKLKFIVQDLPSNEVNFQSNLPQDLVTRITYQTHDFFTPQPTTADVFLLKTILHDWPNSAACAILRNLIPAIRTGTRILICENVAPSPFNAQETSVLPMTVQRLISSADLQMLTLYNNLERGMEQWSALIKEADERLEIRNVFTLPGALRSILEVVKA